MKNLISIILFYFASIIFNPIALAGIITANFKFAMFGVLLSSIAFLVFSISCNIVKTNK